MKKFRFADIHFVIIGLIFLGLVALIIRLTPSFTILLFTVFLLTVSFVVLLIYQNHTCKTDELDKIRHINHQAESSMTSLLENLPVGVVKIDEKTDEIEWFNPFAELTFTKEDGDFDDDRLRDILAVGRDKTRIYAEFSGKRYIVHTDFQNELFYFFDVSSEYKATQEVASLRPVIGVISVDNYDDLEDTMSDSELSEVNSFVSSFITNFSQQHQIFYRRVAMNRFYVFTDYAVLDQLMTEKFSIIDQFRSEAKSRHLAITLSMGFAFGNDNHHTIGQLALQNLNMAEVRGGDQAVVKENSEQKQPIYFGGNTASTTKRTRTRTRAMMSAISDKINFVSKVFIVGHQKLDMDALGASVGMHCFAQNLIEEVYVVYDETAMFSDISRAVEQLSAEASTNLVTVSEALEMVTRDSLLIMVDHSKVSLTLSQALYEKFDQVIVIDHHRRDSDFPQNAIIAYIESGASSTSELVTELLQFQNSKKRRLSRLQSSLLMAGIMLDTRHFSARVTSRTFDVASYLRSCGSDSIMIQDISATDFEESRAVSELILKANQVLPNIIIVKAEEEKLYDKVTMSKTADNLLMLAGIEGTFVIARSDQGQVSISARSRNNINVQRIMENMGGGGHFNLAAAQISNQTVQEVFVELREIIFKEVLENIE